MSIDIPCKICNRRSLMRHTVSSKWFEPKHFCSKECKRSDTSTKYLIYGSISGLIAIISFPTSIFLVTFIIFIIALGITIYSIYLRGSGFPPKQLEEVNENSNRKDGSVNKSKDQVIFSSILEKEVTLCCYQSARMNDKYHVCGRALEYPTQYN